MHRCLGGEPRQLLEEHLFLDGAYAVAGVCWDVDGVEFGNFDFLVDGGRRRPVEDTAVDETQREVTLIP